MYLAQGDILAGLYRMYRRWQGKGEKKVRSEGMKEFKKRPPQCASLLKAQEQNTSTRGVKGAYMLIT